MTTAYEIEHAKAQKEGLKPYTMDEINNMLNKVERDFEAGLDIPSEEVFRELEAAFLY